VHESVGTTSGSPRVATPVRETAQGTWFLPDDGVPGSLLRLPAGVQAAAVRRLHRLELPGLLPIRSVVVDSSPEDGDRVWIATPLPPGPTVDDLLVVGRDVGLGAGDAAAVLSAVGRALRALHARSLGHGALDASAVLLAPDGAPVLVAVTGVDVHRERDSASWARLAWTLADSWCRSDPAVAGDLRGCADLAEAVGLGDALGALPSASGGAGRRRAVGSWAAGTARAAG
jgi:hypothetical protein